MDIFSILNQQLGSGRVLENVLLSKYTTLRVGGPSEFFFVARTSEEIVKAYKTAKELKISFTILGGGTNILVGDYGIKGLVVRNESRGIQIIKKLGKVKNGEINTEKVLLEVGTGTLINQLVRFACDEGLGGLECHLGLPGTIGGALYMNSKWTKPVSYVGDILYQAKILTDDGQVKLVDRNYFDFAYDQSILQKTHEVVLSAIFIFKTEDSKLLWEKANASMEYRKITQPMGIASAGCTFRNISQADSFRIATPNNTTSAGYLVDQVGLKDFKIGNAKFSTLHANFILNTGNAKAAEVKGLIDEAKKRVNERFQVNIEPEIVMLGQF